MGVSSRRKITVALAGNPNVGKSTLFNVLTGLRQHTGNWPGKTVTSAVGRCHYGQSEIRFVDLPGTYSLEGMTEDEQIAGEYIRTGGADCVVAVCDGSCLERNLILALQVLSLRRPTVLCVNLMDEAQAQGISIDQQKLSKELGVPVVLTAAGRKKGIRRLLQQIVLTAERGSLPEAEPVEDPVCAAQSIAQACIRVDTGRKQDWRRELDKLLVGRRHGIPVMLGLLLGIVWLTVWGANYPGQLLQSAADLGYRFLQQLLSGIPDRMRNLILDGVYTTCTRVICVMLPPMAIFFPLFTFLEDVGYLPRMAFLLDHGMRRCGGCGKQALTMCMGLGCNAVGVIGCRIIDSPRERLAAILTNAMIPCNGRFPTLIILGSLFFPGAGSAFAVAACVALGMTGAMAVSGVLNKTVLKGKESTFVMEIPPFRRPRLGQIFLRSLLDQTLRITGRALRVAAPAGALLWLLGNMGIMTRLSEGLEPIGLLMGMNGAVLLAFFLSLPANELLIPIVLMILTGAGSLAGVTGLGPELLIKSGFTWQMAVCTMVFTLFHWPCATTLLTIRRETGSMKKTAVAFLLPTAVGTILCVILRFVLQNFGG